MTSLIWTLTGLTVAITCGLLALGLRRRIRDLKSIDSDWRLAENISTIVNSASTIDEALAGASEQLNLALQARSATTLRVITILGKQARVSSPASHPDATERSIDLEGHDPEVEALRMKCWRVHPLSKVLSRLVIPVYASHDDETRPVAWLSYECAESRLNERARLLDATMGRLCSFAQRELDRERLKTQARQMDRLHIIASRANIGVLIMNRQGIVEWVNPTLMALTGWAKDQVRGRSLIETLGSYVATAETPTQLGQCLRDGEPFKLNFECSRHVSGQPPRYWAELDAFEVRNEQGDTAQFVCIFTDISVRKEQEIQREHEETFKEALLANLPVSLFVIDPSNNHVVTINRHAELEFNLRKEQVVGKSVQEALGHDALKRVDSFMSTSSESGAPVDHDFNLNDGRQMRVLNARHYLLRNANGSPRLMISLVRDITASQRALADLEESERRFRELVESMDDGVYVCDGANTSCLYASPRTAVLLGSTTAEKLDIAERLREMVIDDDRQTLAYQESQIQKQASTDTLLRLDVAGRGIRWMRHKTRSRNLLNGESRIYGLLSDVTDDREQALELQHARDEAESASRAKSEFMANMSHEIRTPMNGILGMTELLLGTDLTDKQKRFAQSVYRSGENLLEIINDILDFAKIDAGQMELSQGDFELRTLIEDTLELLAPRAHERGLELTYREAGDLPAILTGDALRLRQVLTNLVANAIKFTEHGEVVVDVQRVASSADAPPGQLTLHFQVRDTGIGIAEEALPRIFQAFVQGHGGSSRRYGGTGLGLPISKQLVKLLGGELNVSSMPGIGSIFSFTLAFGIKAGVAMPDTTEDQGLMSGHVLVVDDNETNRTILENMLTAWGIQVTLAQNGKDALSLVLGDAGSASDVDLALIDMHMPEMDGLSTAEALVHSRRHENLPMILLSSMSSQDESRRAQEAGFACVLHKPLRKSELQQTLYRFLGQPSATPAQESMWQDKRILIVEDNPVNQEVCAQMLRRMGCQVRVTSSALEGLRRLGEERFDAILMDIQMPGMDGIEALGWFRKGGGNRFQLITSPETPVIAVTANALEGDEQRFINLGFDDYLSKPFRQAQLQNVLLKHTSKLEGHPPDSHPGAIANQVETRTVSPAEIGSNSQTEQLLDAEALRRLKELDPTGENRLLERVARAFETSLSRLLPQLTEAEEQQDFMAIAQVVHTLKSSSASIGALKLSQMCADIENIIRRQTGEDLTSRIKEVPVEAERVQAGLRQVLEAQA